MRSFSVLSSCSRIDSGEGSLLGSMDCGSGSGEGGRSLLARPLPLGSGTLTGAGLACLAAGLGAGFAADLGVDFAVGLGGRLGAGLGAGFAAGLGASLGVGFGTGSVSGWGADDEEDNDEAWGADDEEDDDEASGADDGREWKKKSRPLCESCGVF